MKVKLNRYSAIPDKTDFLRSSSVNSFLISAESSAGFNVLFRKTCNTS